MCELRDQLDRVTKEGSRQVADVGNKTGFDWLEQEGDKNTKNPGRAYTRAAAAMASYYAGGLLGGAASGAAGGAAGAAGNVATTASEEATQQAMRQLLIEAAKDGADVGYVPEVHGLLQGTASNAPEVGSELSANSGSRVGAFAKNYAMKQGLNLLMPQQQPQQPGPKFQSQQGPLTMPYQDMTNLSEEQKQKLRAMGYAV